VVGTVEVDGFASRWVTAVYAESQATASPAPGSPVVDQRGLRFRPSVVAIPVGTTVVFRNGDPVIHSVFSPGLLGAAERERDAFDLGRFFPGTEGRHTAQRAGVLVILCRLHPEMAAYIVVAPTLAVTVTDTAGRFQLTGLPPGPTTLRFWHPLRAPGTVRVALEPGRTSVVNIRLLATPR
jgi:plastocyanin